MKNIITFILSLALLFLIGGCSQFAYQASATTASTPPGWTPITLDDSYEFYYRAITSEDEPVVGTGRTQKRLGLHSDTKLMNPGVAGAVNKKIIEIEYLWVSPQKKTVIYISTVADRFQNRYSNPLRFAGLDHPNGADFRVFLIGKIDDSDPNQFTFYAKDGIHTDNWTIDKGGDQITLLRIAQKRNTSFESVYEINDALNHGMTFRRQIDWHMVFIQKDAQNKNDQEATVNNSFYYLQDGKTFNLFIPFKTTTISFKDKYVIYRPDRKAK